MAERKPAKNAVPKSARRAPAKGGAAEGFSDEERAAMRERARELKAASRSRAGAESDESAVLARIAAMPLQDRAMGERLHAIIRGCAPDLSPKLWYGMPAYARGGKVVCFFQDAQKFKSRYATLGFTDEASLDDGDMWPSAFALKDLSTVEEARIGALVKRAVGG